VRVCVCVCARLLCATVYCVRARMHLRGHRCNNTCLCPVASLRVRLMWQRAGWHALSLFHSQTHAHTGAAACLSTSSQDSAHALARGACTTATASAVASCGAADSLAACAHNMDVNRLYEQCSALAAAEEVEVSTRCKKNNLGVSGTDAHRGKAAIVCVGVRRLPVCGGWGCVSVCEDCHCMCGCAKIDIVCVGVLRLPLNLWVW
jgi:hypothetical protein